MIIKALKTDFKVVANAIVFGDTFLNLSKHLRELNTMAFQLKTIKLHLIYWLALVLFFTFIWGSYDHDYLRNFMVQLYSLPARLILVYGTILFLIPRFFLKEKYLEFFIGFVGLLIISGVVVQRSIMVFMVQGHYLPYKSETFFRITELMNTILDVNNALIIPLVYVFVKKWNASKEKSQALAQENLKLSKAQEEHVIHLKEGNQRHKIAVKDILFIESLKNYVKITTLENELTIYKSLSALEDMLPKNMFLRVHRSFIVSTEHISSYSPTKVILNNVTIPVGRKYKEAVKTHLNY
ncbi:LytR/AlgR family response regulator transcription factor [Seonamhaeicola marinus]|uniref:LytTR family transcriptional regulator n=1 Tax=Seonamhaeicola marinus TaxID=1912246 RepID=A0A5D0HST9_9FLAO|nr:LytTR family DNA-binding domain-containing protein [Seonamhaeicola marinus]TYA74040.1 LytTR family transcriptional regulator [Seonamhaeicola marinus]